MVGFKQQIYFFLSKSNMQQKQEICKKLQNHTSFDLRMLEISYQKNSSTIKKLVLSQPYDISLQQPRRSSTVKKTHSLCNNNIMNSGKRIDKRLQIELMELQLQSVKWQLQYEKKQKLRLLKRNKQVKTQLQNTKEQNQKLNKNMQKMKAIIKEINQKLQFQKKDSFQGGIAMKRQQGMLAMKKQKQGQKQQKISEKRSIYISNRIQNQVQQIKELTRMNQTLKIKSISLQTQMIQKVKQLNEKINKLQEQANLKNQSFLKLQRRFQDQQDKHVKVLQRVYFLNQKLRSINQLNIQAIISEQIQSKAQLSKKVNLQNSDSLKRSQLILQIIIEIQNRLVNQLPLIKKSSIDSQQDNKSVQNFI